MKDIQKRELTRAIDLIKALGCTYKVITPDGEAFGELEVAEPRSRKVRAPLKYPFGAVTTHIKKHLNLDATVGIVQDVPCGEFDPESVRSTLCALLHKTWGVKTYTTCSHPEKVEVMRIAMEAS